MSVSYTHLQTARASSQLSAPADPEPGCQGRAERPVNVGGSRLMVTEEYGKTLGAVCGKFPFDSGQQRATVFTAHDFTL